MAGQALVLEKVKKLAVRDIDVSEPFTPHDVRIDIRYRAARVAPHAHNV